MSAFQHETVMLRETLAAIAPRAGGLYVDVTLGGGGHAEALLEASAPTGRVIGIDRDPEALAAARARLARFGDRFTAVHAPFGRLAESLEPANVGHVNGIVADLGVSSPQLDQPARGFSFTRPGPLDMRMDPTSGEPLSELLAAWSADTLADVLYTLGDERRSRPIARSIKAAFERGQLETTEDLRRAVVRVAGPRRGGIDPATRTFQALRMAVNRELEQLDALLAALPEVLADAGRVAIISFHSGEDRRIKRAFRDHPALSPLVKRPLVAGAEEQARNPRSRSAKLRIAARVAPGEGADRELGGRA